MTSFLEKSLRNCPTEMLMQPSRDHLRDRREYNLKIAVLYFKELLISVLQGFS